MFDPKKAAAELAVDEFVKSGQVVGLGTGSTAIYAVYHIGEKLKSSQLKDIRAIATSDVTERAAIEHGIPLITPLELAQDCKGIDIAIDGADEIHKVSRDLIKGRGGALFREKTLEMEAKRFICVADESKLVDCLGVGLLPVEVCKYGWNLTAKRLKKSVKGIKDIVVRGGSDPFVTDNGNYILDIAMENGRIEDPAGLAKVLESTVGVVEHGLFLGFKPEVVIGYKSKERAEIV